MTTLTQRIPQEVDTGEHPRFNVHAVIAYLLESTDEPNPHVLARQVFAAIPEDRRGQVLQEALADMVRKVIREARNHAAPVPSTKWGAVSAAVADGQIRVFRQRVYARGTWKLVGDCDADDLRDIASGYRMRAERNADHAERWGRLENLVVERGVEHVRDLKPREVEDVLYATS